MSKLLHKTFHKLRSWKNDATARLFSRMGAEGAAFQGSVYRDAGAGASNGAAIVRSVDDEFRQKAYHFALIALAAKLAAADGDITEDEFGTFTRLFPQASEDMAKARRLFFMAKTDPSPFERYARQIASLFPEKQFMEGLFRKLYILAQCDGGLTAEEKEMLGSIAKIMQLEALQAASGEPKVKNLHEPYILLGIPPSADNEEIKRAYRSRMRELHPDTLTARGMSQEAILKAGEELIAVREAYTLLCRRRKIK